MCSRGGEAKIINYMVKLAKCSQIIRPLCLPPLIFELEKTEIVATLHRTNIIQQLWHSSWKLFLL